MALTDKVAVVTGGASGIGRAIALRLARDGAHVALWDVDVSGARKVAEEIAALGRRALVAEVDVAVHADAVGAAARVRRELGRVQILVNDAGIAEVVPLAKMSEEQWDRTVGVHLKGTFNCTRALLQDVVSGGWGRIVNVSSVAGLKGAAGFVHYSAAKAGIVGFTKALAYEVASAGVTVNAIAPGLIDTPIVRKANLSEETLAGIVRGTPISRWGLPEDIAAACAYVVSPEAGFLTGQVISPNGGAHVW